MSAPTATAAALITEYRDMIEFMALATIEQDSEAAAAARADRARIVAALVNSGQGWIGQSLSQELAARLVFELAPEHEKAQPWKSLRTRERAVDAILARCA